MMHQDVLDLWDASSRWMQVTSIIFLTVWLSSILTAIIWVDSLNYLVWTLLIAWPLIIVTVAVIVWLAFTFFIGIGFILAYLETHGTVDTVAPTYNKRVMKIALLVPVLITSTLSICQAFAEDIFTRIPKETDDVVTEEILPVKDES
jgi:hypothetical protein